MKQLQVTKYFRYTILVPVAILMVAIVCIAVRGVNLGVDFAGGTMLTMDLGSSASQMDDSALSAKVEELVSAQTDADFRVSLSGESDVIIHIQDSAMDRTAQEESVAAIENSIAAEFSEMVLVNAESVGAVVGAELVTNAVTALIFASILMLIYITVRFEFWSGVATIFGQVHDLLVMLAITMILNLKINSSLVAAVLTVMGYSINNTIIVLDRVREYRRTNTTHMTREEIVNLSVSKTLMRSVNTSLTTLFTVGALYVMGMTSIREFTLPIIVGICCGIYSSILLSGPFWAMVCNWAENLKLKREKAQRTAKKA